MDDLKNMVLQRKKNAKDKSNPRKSRRSKKLKERRIENKIIKEREKTEKIESPRPSTKGLTFKQRKELNQLRRQPKINEGQLRKMFNRGQFMFNGNPVNGPYVPPVIVDPRVEYNPPYDPEQARKERQEREEYEIYQKMFQDDERLDSESPYRPLENDVYQSDSPMVTSEMLESYVVKEAPVRTHSKPKPKTRKNPEPKAAPVITAPTRPKPKPKTLTPKPAPSGPKPTPKRPQPKTRKRTNVSL